jgi:anti-sigma-K factor RskA
MRYDSPELRERLAAEYVLGTMPGRSRRRFERLIAEEPALARLVGAWADRLAPLDMATPPQEPPARVWRAIEGRIARAAAPPRPAPSWRDSLAFWRGLAIAASVATVVLALYLAVFSGPATAPVPTVVAVLADHGGAPGWIAITGPRHGEISVSAIRPAPAPAGRSFELWGIAGGSPRPLGLLRPQPGHATIMRAGEMPPPGGVLAVSLEPANGSPTGRPTGPVLYQGTVMPRRS